jgi:Collagen triple helix repeat (20 copies)
MQRLRGKLTYANVVATLALFLVLAGGTAVAASQLAKNSVGSKQIKKAAVTPAKLSTAAKATLTGTTGPKGATGPQGPQGDPGTRGEAGVKGEPGQSATALWAVINGSNGGWSGAAA